MAAGLGYDTKQLDDFIIDGVALEIGRIEHQRQLTSASARPTPENQEIRRLAAETAREAEQYRAELASRPAAARKRYIPMVAPVSREPPSTVTGQRRPSQITLNHEERQVAAISFPHLSKDQAELEYANDKRRMIQMKANGEIQGDG